MRSGYLSSWAALTLMLATANSIPAAAEESGHWHGLGALVITDQKVAKVEDRANHTSISASATELFTMLTASLSSTPLPAAWSVEEEPACFVVRDRGGLARRGLNLD